ncbi:MAG: hypothetical protein WCC26_00015 [Terracidiphilus sp.]
MSSSIFYAGGMVAAISPFLAILGILGWHSIRSLVVSRKQSRGRRILASWSSAFVLGTAFQFLQVIYRPSTTHVMEAKQDDHADEDDSGETLPKQLNRQLRRIRHGERIDKIVLTLADSESKKVNP